MTNQQFIDEFSGLPKEAQQQVADFIGMLRKRYGDSTARSRQAATELAAEPFIGMWRDRVDLDESSRWRRA